MAEFKPQEITSLNDLQETYVNIKLSDLNIKVPEASSQSAPQREQTRLVLLQPLADTDTLAACRDPESRKLYRNDGLLCGTTNNEYLNIQPLSLAWRKALMGTPPIPNLTFDLTLPRVEKQVGEADNGTDQEERGQAGMTSSQRIYWETALPYEGGIAVKAQDIMTMAITIATLTRMRSQGDVQFDVIYNEADRPSSKAMSTLKKQLLELSHPKSSAQGEDAQSTAEDEK